MVVLIVSVGLYDPGLHFDLHLVVLSYHLVVAGVLIEFAGKSHRLRVLQILALIVLSVRLILFIILIRLFV